VHETGIAWSILETAKLEAARAGAPLATVGVHLGEMSGVVEEALRFAFEALRAEAGVPEAGVGDRTDFRGGAVPEVRLDAAARRRADPVVPGLRLTDARRLGRADGDRVDRSGRVEDEPALARETGAPPV